MLTMGSSLSLSSKQYTSTYNIYELCEISKRKPNVLHNIYPIQSNLLFDINSGRYYISIYGSRNKNDILNYYINLTIIEFIDLIKHFDHEMIKNIRLKFEYADSIRLNQ